MNLLRFANQTATGARILWEWLGDGGDVVEKELAQQRANTCIKCPKNEKGNVVTKAVAWGIKEQTDFKNDLKLTVDGEKALQTCSVCTCWIRLKIWIPMEKLNKDALLDESEKWPEWCWMRTEV